MGGKFKDGAMLNKKIKLLWLGLGTKEPDPFFGSVGAFCDMLKEVGKNMFIMNLRILHMNG